MPQTNFIQNQEHVFQHPLALLAEMSGTSQGAWIRFCKSMGYSGMKDLKKALFDETSRSADDSGQAPVRFTDVQDFSSVSAIAENVCASCIEAIRMTHLLFDETVMTQAADSIIRSDSVKLYGIGASGLIAQDLYQKLLRIGCHTDFTPDFHVAMTYIATSTPNDTAVLISHSGETPEVLHAAEFLRKNGTPIIGITKNAPSSLAAIADYILFMDSPEVHSRSGAISSRAAQFLLSDILFTTVANRNYANIEGHLESTYAIFPSSPHKQRRDHLPLST
ncbi:MAG: MurR/RpiR family transcriptional regulator [Lachnospiraceae bacterium]|nr:MurR/RpiR family transcriptional regulator [Lachnospiraceae bacterium]